MSVYGWSPGIGDPTVWGWFTVANYMIAFFLAVRAGRKDWRHAKFWTFTSVLMLALCINKQLDLQSLLTEIGREFARRYDWYQKRQYVQMVFIKSIIFASVLAGTILLFAFRKSQATIIGATIGMALLTSFIAARAASFHHMDRALGITFIALKLNHILENAGIFLISFNATLAVSPARIRNGKK